MQREVILSSEEDIKSMCKQLEEIDECAKCLGNDDSVRVLQHKPKLAQLKSVQQKQVVSDKHLIISMRLDKGYMLNFSFRCL